MTLIKDINMDHNVRPSTTVGWHTAGINSSVVTLDIDKLWLSQDTMFYLAAFQLNIHENICPVFCLI